MATVGITKELITRVERKIDTMRKAERISDIPSIDTSYSIDASLMYNIGCWGAEHVHIVDIIPSSWMETATDEVITVSGHTEVITAAGLTETTALKANVRFTEMAYAYKRIRANYWDRIASEMTPDQVRAFPEETPGRAQLLQRWDDAINELALNNRWAKVAVDVVGFLNKCKSLNEAVKLFPAVRMYIAHEDLQRLDRKLERPAQRADILESVDTAGLTAAAIAAKLALAS